MPILRLRRENLGENAIFGGLDGKFGGKKAIFGGLDSNYGESQHIMGYQRPSPEANIDAEAQFELLLLSSRMPHTQRRGSFAYVNFY